MTWILSLVLAMLSMSLSQNTGAPPGETTIIYLMRHAEKAEPLADQPYDPHLSVAGHVRAAQLAKLLEFESLTHIYTTDFLRTRQTVAPLASSHNIEVELYNPRALEAFAKTIKSKQGRVVIVGHSNSTPELVRLLGGEPGNPIDEKTEFDRLYILYINPDKPVTTAMLKYGG